LQVRLSYFQQKINVTFPAMNTTK